AGTLRVEGGIARLRCRSLHCVHTGGRQSALGERRGLWRGRRFGVGPNRHHQPAGDEGFLRATGRPWRRRGARQRRRASMRRIAAGFLLAIAAWPAAVRAQDDVTSRTELIEKEQQAKSEALKPAAPGKAEAYVTRIADTLLSGNMHWHAFWTNAYSGGGFTVGAGYTQFVSGYNTLDVRGSITPSGYKRLESEFIAPEIFGRRGTLSVLGGWREATQVGFYGFGMGSSKDDRTNYSFTQPYLSALLTVFPTKRLLLLRGGLEVSQWRQGAGQGDFPSVGQG